MNKVRGGMEFPAGRLRQIAPPPTHLTAGPVLLRVPHRPEVHTGQPITAGQALTDPRGGGVGCHVSPYDGTVERMEPIDSPDTDQRLYELQLSPGVAEAETSLPVEPPVGRKLANWLAALRKIDPWAELDGGVGLLPQLEAARQRKPDTVILNGVDRFPPYPDSSSLLAGLPDAAATGLRLLADLVDVDRAELVVSRETQVAAHLRIQCRRHAVRLAPIHNIYPSADPTLLTWLVAPDARRVPARSNPVAQRALIVNPWTAIRLGRWITRRRFDIVRPMLIGWPEAGTRLTVRYGIPGQALTHLHERLARIAETAGSRILVGHPMTGHRAHEGDVEDGEPFAAVVPHHESLLTVLGSETALERDEQPCITCGWCAHVCPTQLRPAHLLRLCRRGGPADVLLTNLAWCIDCGLCSHVCPSDLPLTQSFRQMSTRFERILK